MKEVPLILRRVCEHHGVRCVVADCFGRLGLRKGEHILEDLRVLDQRAPVYLEQRVFGFQDDVAVVKPELCILD